MIRRFYLVLILFAWLASIGIGGAAHATPHGPSWRYAHWGSSFWPDVPESLRIGTRAPAAAPKPVLKRERAAGRPPVFGSGACGGDLPGCGVLACESHGNLIDHNPSGADGKWQFMPGTWHGYGGYTQPSDAPEATQDERARQVWAGGRGASNWSQCLR